MAPASQPIAVAELRRWLERTEAHGCDGRASLFSGVTALDDHLPVGAFALDHLHEVMEGGPASEYAALALPTPLA
jgi:protein ImuA